jgi:hypothetical protein
MKTFVAEVGRTQAAPLTADPASFLDSSIVKRLKTKASSNTLATRADAVQKLTSIEIGNIGAMG